MTGLAGNHPNKLAVALAVREAMRAHRRGKPISFTWPTRPKGWR